MKYASLEQCLYKPTNESIFIGDAPWFRPLGEDEGKGKKAIPILVEWMDGTTSKFLSMIELSKKTGMRPAHIHNTVRTKAKSPKYGIKSINLVPPK